MQALVETIAKSLVEDPGAVEVTEEEERGILNLTLRVADADMGKVIGKQGKIANAIRQVLKACAIKEDKKVNLEIISAND